MTEIFSQEQLNHLASQWLPREQVPGRFRIHTNTGDFFRIEYGDIVLLNGTPYLIRHNARGHRFEFEDEVKYWVKRAIDLRDGSLKIMKLEFYERFMTRLGNIELECFRSPRKEARILDLVSGRRNFMQGFSTQDDAGNLVRILDFIKGTTLSTFVGDMGMDHEAYYYAKFPSLLGHFMECIQAIGFLHENGEKHGDIKGEHVLIQKESGQYRWIDFDSNYRHRENIYGYDLFGLGNILVFLAAGGEVLLSELRKTGSPSLSRITGEDLNLVFSNQLVNLKKIYPYLPEPLNRVLMHFSKGAQWFYENTSQLLGDLGEVQGIL